MTEQQDDTVATLRIEVDEIRAEWSNAAGARSLDPTDARLRVLEGMVMMLTTNLADACARLDGITGVGLPESYTRQFMAAYTEGDLLLGGFERALAGLGEVPGERCADPDGPWPNTLTPQEAS